MRHIGGQLSLRRLLLRLELLLELLLLLHEPLLPRQLVLTVPLIGLLSASLLLGQSRLHCDRDVMNVAMQNIVGN